MTEQLYRLVVLTPEEALNQYIAENNLKEGDVWIEVECSQRIELGSNSPLHVLVKLNLSYYEPV